MRSTESGHAAQWRASLLQISAFTRFLLAAIAAAMLWLVVIWAVGNA